MSLAKAVISGILANDPEKRFTPNDVAVTNFTLQVHPVGRNNEAPFSVRITCWRNLADLAVEQLRKGDEVTVEGRLQVNQYEGSDGVARRMFEIDANHLYLGSLQALASPADMQAGRSPRQPQSSLQGSSSSGASQSAVPVGAAVSNSPENSSFLNEDLLTEDDIPF